MTKQTEQAIKVACAACNNPFTALTVKQKYCSDECKAEGKREANRRFYAVHGSSKADPKNQARTLIEQYLWALTGENIADGWTGDAASVAFQRRTSLAEEKLKPMMNADARRLLDEIERLTLMLNIKALARGKHADLSTIEHSEQSLREAIARALDGLAETMARTEAGAA